MKENYDVMNLENGLVKMWTRGVPVEDGARKQLANIAAMPFVHRWIAAMPDVHIGKGATIGSVIPTIGAIIPAAVGVDLGCGMMAVRTSLQATDLPNNLAALRFAIESAVPHGRTNHGRRGDRGAWGTLPKIHRAVWNSELADDFKIICEKNPKIRSANSTSHLGTLGGGNHFIEVCLDETDQVWVMLHSGSRGVGNRIGSHFIKLAKQEMERWFIHLPDKDLAYLPQNTVLFNEYIEALSWAQKFAKKNRELMMQVTLTAMREELVDFTAKDLVIDCHHNYVSREKHFKKSVIVTRKGAVSARKGEWGIIPGSMGTRSYIVQGKGNKDSFHSCSHGAGRAMSRSQARKRFTLRDHEKATAGVECRKDLAILDETPGAYKDIDQVMAAQADLVEIKHTLRQVICIKG